MLPFISPSFFPSKSTRDVSLCNGTLTSQLQHRLIHMPLVRSIENSCDSIGVTHGIPELICTSRDDPRRWACPHRSSSNTNRTWGRQRSSQWRLLEWPWRKWLGLLQYRQFHLITAIGRFQRHRCRFRHNGHTQCVSLASVEPCPSPKTNAYSVHQRLQFARASSTLSRIMVAHITVTSKGVSSRTPDHFL